MKGYDELPIIAKDFGGAVSITKTPTKEQIEKIWSNNFDTTNTFVLTYVDKKLIEIIITEWEKIRSQK